MSKLCMACHKQKFSRWLLTISAVSVLLGLLTAPHLLAGAAASLPMTRKKPRAEKVLDAADMSGIFGLDLEGGPAPRTAKAASHGPARKSRAIKPKGKRKS